MEQALASPRPDPNYLPAPSTTRSLPRQPPDETPAEDKDGLLSGLYNVVISVIATCLKHARTVTIHDEPVTQFGIDVEKSAISSEQNGDPTTPTLVGVPVDSHRDLPDQMADIAARLLLWGGVITSGKAEATATLFPDLYRSIAELLRDCAKDLQKLRVVFAFEEPQNSVAATSTLNVWLEKAEFALDTGFGTTEVDKHADNPSQDVQHEADALSLSSSVSDLSQSGRDTLIESLDENVSLLMDLLPSIDHLPNPDQLTGHIGFLSTRQFEISAPAQPFIQKISENYSSAPPGLVERLGEANWQRFCKLRLRQEETLAAELGQAKSVFHDSAIGTSLGRSSDDACTVVSHSSFVSSAADDTHHFNRVPPEPREVALAKPFKCPICSNQLTNIRNRVHWKLHVFQDLKPYICLFDKCSHMLNTFPSREAWSEHDLKEHRQELRFECHDCHYVSTIEIDFKNHVQESHSHLNPHQISKLILAATRTKTEDLESWQCPLCCQSGFPTMRKFTAHVCAHMEDIALATLPLDLYGDDDEKNMDIVEYIYNSSSSPVSLSSWGSPPSSVARVLSVGSPINIGMDAILEAQREWDAHNRDEEDRSYDQSDTVAPRLPSFVPLTPTQLQESASMHSVHGSESPLYPTANSVLQPKEEVSNPREDSKNKLSDVRRKLTDLTDDERRLICLEAENNPTMKQMSIGAKFNVERSTVSQILRQRDKYMKPQPKGEVANPRKDSPIKLPDIEKALAHWAGNQQRRGLHVTIDELRKQVLMFTSRRNDQQLYTSTEWLENFQRQYLNKNSKPADPEHTVKTSASHSETQNSLFSAASGPSYILPSPVETVESPWADWLGSQRKDSPGDPVQVTPGFESSFPSVTPWVHAEASASSPPVDRPFKCDECSQTFRLNHDLKRHRRIHLAVKPFPCSHCDKSFSRKDALKRHILVKGCGKAVESDSNSADAAKFKKPDVPWN